MKTITTAFQMFLAALEVTTKEVPFNPAWRNGTGYYDSAVHMVELKAGEMAKSQDEAPNSRRILLIGTELGTVVIFERYTPGSGSPEVLVSNMPNAIERLMMDRGALTFNQMCWLTGGNDLGSAYGFENDNIGKRLLSVRGRREARQSAEA